MEYSISHARKHFETLVKQAEGGRDVILTRNGVPVARVLAYSDQAAITRPDPEQPAASN